ncbi:hypothetical protein GGR50DRAFT_665280 [Xylaria sp. CBS 124048]|nr:hypothetical protein GGR50DRAFT_665280 [Xylaria sp. CBS 124048]
MARLTQEPITPRRSASDPDSRTDLNRLLARLQQNILHADVQREQRLRASEHERNKAAINVEYARALLAKLEQDALAIKAHARRQELQLDLSRKRAVLEMLTERLRELGEISIGSDEDDSDDGDDGEDLLGNIIPTPSQSSGSRSGEQIQEEIKAVEEDDGDEGESTILSGSRRTEQPSQQQVPPTPTAASIPPPSHSNPPEPSAIGASITTTATSSTLRPRGSATGAQPTATNTATTTGALRSQLLGAAATSSAPPTTTTETTEAILDHHRAEQDKLTESMVSMAKTLKASSHAFSTALREDQDVLAGAGRGLDRNERGLEGVAGRMGTLRRLTEGKGWWGRMILYAWIAGLAVLALLLVFVLPKLRF